MTQLGTRLIQAAMEASDIVRGRADRETYRTHVPMEIDVRAIRAKLKLTQTDFASLYGFPIGTLRDLEQGRAKPDSSTRAYLTVISREPLAVQRALSGKSDLAGGPLPSHPLPTP